MTTCRITLQPNSTGKIYLYQEQALFDNLSKPYRQRFLEISNETITGKVRSLSYRPAQPEKWVNLCAQPQSARIVSSIELGKATCAVFLAQSGDGYIGRTPPNGCPSKVRGAIRVTNQIILRENSMETWDRGFDVNGKQVWGAQSDSYQFRKASP